MGFCWLRFSKRRSVVYKVMNLLYANGVSCKSEWYVPVVRTERKSCWVRANKIAHVSTSCYVRLSVGVI